MPTRDVEKTNSKLQKYFETEFWKGDPKRFGTNGTQEGLFLLPNYEIKEVWFPTSVKVKPAPFEICFEHKGKVYKMNFREGEIITNTGES